MDGSKAVIMASDDLKTVGVFLPWNGGRDIVESYLMYCKIRGYDPPERDCTGWTNLCNVMTNVFGSSLKIGIDTGDKLECNNWNNGVYIINNWEIIGRKYFNDTWEEQRVYNFNLLKALIDIDNHQPKPLGEQVIRDYLNKLPPKVKGEN